MAEQKEEDVLHLLSAPSISPTPCPSPQPTDSLCHRPGNGSPESTCLTSPWQGDLDPRQTSLPGRHGQAAWHGRELPFPPLAPPS